MNSIYQRYIKRVLDVVFSSIILVGFSWLFLLIYLLVRLRIGSPVIFKQVRPGKFSDNNQTERLFLMYKFRTMTNDCDEKGVPLPDELRLTRFGKFLRSTSLDELPEMINILKGDMSFVGPRPQLVRDMVFMSQEERQRHLVKPGLTGLAQIKGRNSITWKKKLDYDIKYINNISLLNDIKIIIATALKLLINKNRSAEIDVTDDYGVSLLKKNEISREYFDEMMNKAHSLEVEFRRKSDGKI